MKPTREQHTWGETMALLDSVDAAIAELDAAKPKNGWLDLQRRSLDLAARAIRVLHAIPRKSDALRDEIASMRDELDALAALARESEKP